MTPQNRISFCISAIVLIFLTCRSTNVFGNEVERDREGRFVLLSLNPDPCSVNNVNGTCYTATSCSRRGGISIGKCGIGGVGTCCKFEIGCSNSSTYRTVNETTVTIKDSRSCNYEFPKREGYCQLRVEIVNLYSDPTSDGLCAGGVFTVRGSQTVTDFPFCGKSAKPLYFAYGDDSIISLGFTNEDGDSTSYEVKVTQLKCDSRERIPDHCLQQFEGTTGEIRSFGYPNGYVKNQYYTSCVKSKRASIQWTKCDNQLDPTLGIPLQSNYKDFYTSKWLWNLAAFGDECEKSSYVALSGAKYCGTILQTVLTTVKPFTLSTKWASIDEFTTYPNAMWYYNYEKTPSTTTCTMDSAAVPSSIWTRTNAVMVPNTVVPDKVICFATKAATAPSQPPPIGIEGVNPGYCLRYTLM